MQDRLYLVIRRDLPLGLAAAQAAHAAFSFALRFPDVTTDWMRDSQYLVLVTVPDEEALIGLTSRALDEGLQILSWHEPDLADSLTAVALEPGALARRLCANLPLLGRPVLEATG